MTPEMKIRLPSAEGMVADSPGTAACGKTRLGGRPGIYPRHKPHTINAGFQPLRYAFRALSPHGSGFAGPQLSRSLTASFCTKIRYPTCTKIGCPTLGASLFLRLGWGFTELIGTDYSGSAVTGSRFWDLGLIIVRF